jgi:hypothetical protein
MKYLLIIFVFISAYTIDQEVEVLKMEKVTIPGNQKFLSSAI